MKLAFHTFKSLLMNTEVLAVYHMSAHPGEKLKSYFNDRVIRKRSQPHTARRFYKDF